MWRLADAMIAYLDCFSGISGDMLLGALLDAGLDVEVLRAGLESLGVPGWTLDVERVTNGGISGTRAVVRLASEAPHEHRRLTDIAALIAGSSLAAAVKARTLAVFTRLAVAEAHIHGSSPDAVTFHEVGAVDSIVDIAGGCLGLDLLGVTQVFASALPLTSGRVRSAHGALPVPAPATLEQLRDSGADWTPVPASGEQVTPTAAALLAELARFEQPALRVTHIGYGFGQRKLPWANCLRVVLGEAAASEGAPAVDASFERDEVMVIESNIDTMTGESLGWLMERLLASGALDVSYTPLHMKKQRPGVLLTVIARLDGADTLAATILRESATLGVRMRRMARLKAGRREQRIETTLGACRVKLKLEGERILGVSAEYDDCHTLAARHGLPVEVVMARLTAEARRLFGLDGE
ncbi:MAG: nickel pincer cofactor biosynthesis protein LarC [Ktedonobacterales bacterium]